MRATNGFAGGDEDDDPMILSEGDTVVRMKIVQ